MDKKEKSVIAIYAIAFLLFNVIYIGIPFPKITASWIIYAFTVLSIIVSYFITTYAFKKGEDVKSKVYGFPIFRVGYLYVAIQLIYCFFISFFAVFTQIANWIPSIFSIVILGCALIGVIASDNARDIVNKMDEKEVLNTRTVTYFSLDINSILSSCESHVIKKELERLAEEIRYSDPVSSDAVKEIEEKINEELVILKNMIRESDVDVTLKQVNRIMNLLHSRNRICKAEKM